MSQNLTIATHFPTPEHVSINEEFGPATHFVMKNIDNYENIRKIIYTFAVAKTRSNTSRGVAQSGSAPGLGPGGRRFESCRPDLSIIQILFIQRLL